LLPGLGHALGASGAEVRLVFEDGVGYDPDALLKSVEGRYGEY
jgi:hypothetical protein